MNTLSKRNSLAFLSGFSAMTAQAVVLRAFQTVFYGNELSYAVLLSSWLLWIGLGSLFAVRICSKVRLSDHAATAAFCALALAIPGIVLGIRYIKPILETGAGQMIGLIPMVISGMVLSAPAAFFPGMIFVLLYYSEAGQKNTAGKTYLWEALGSGTGGVVFSFFLIKILSVTMTAWCLAALVTAVLLVFYKNRKFLRYGLTLLLMFIVVFFILDMIYDLDYLSQKKQYPSGRLIAVEESPYANLALVKTSEDYSMYQNGMLSFTVNDTLAAEENTHFAMLAHPRPRRVLLIGSGLGGEIAEVFEYPEIRLDFVEIDAQLIDMFKRYVPEKAAELMDHPGLSVHVMDARRFVRTTPQRYDVVIINAGDPYTAGLNRYYTLDFFRELDRILYDGGIVSFRVSSSENFLSEENRTFLRSLDRTMRSVFPEVRSIPGDTHTFLVSNREGRINLDPSLLTARLADSGVQNQFLNEHTLPFRVNPRRVRHVEDILRKKPGLMNTDLFPRAYLFQMILWSTHFDAGLKHFMQYAALPFWVILVFFSVCVTAAGFWKIRRGTYGSVNLAVAVTGFSEIIFQIIVILAFQSLYGTAYDKIALILASFMIGLVAGARRANTLSVQRSKKENLKIFSRVQLCIVVYPLLLPLVFIMFRDIQIFQQWFGFFAVVFACLPFIAGFLGGMQYPLASAIRSAEDGMLRSGGTLYALDAFGASLGALVTGLFLIPLYGIVMVSVLCAQLNAIACFFCLKARKR